MNIAEELISTLSGMTEEEFNFYITMMDSLVEDYEVFKRLDCIIETKLKEFDTSESHLRHATLYYLGFKHGIEDGVQISNEEHIADGDLNVT